MFVGHAALAFAIVGGVAIASGWSSERALAIGVVAGAFAALPDVDMVYALVGIAGASGSDALALAGAFWSTGNVVHRAVTHSLVLALPVALLAALQAVTATRRVRAVSALVATLLVALIATVGGALAAFVTLLFVVGAVAVGAVVDRYTDLTATGVFVAALVGLATHPFGDLFTGEPPAMLYPFDAALVTERVALAADPTLHLLAAFGVELATIWAAVAVVCLATGLRPTAAVTRRASLGAGYAASVLLIPAPTLDLSYPFVFSVLGVGLLGVLPQVRLIRSRGPTVEPPDWLTAALTGLSAITVAWLAYAVAYVVVG
ncbi:metal-dependent hydrolase [Haloplanus aerogenes]|uniref:Hydrolase n=1 Tax=Haloplanus aerogenes TaxID=660522 RepID=A0A3M0D2R4_9EURY|nr:metal-dependent hydrolase [Haloplanus aerogenes]AZH25153.1 hydrolase [Haloplanus aerogenes]RMB13619.1 LexA-binding, inner membrane-associated putative hydrolase [Haloplanus aerogenes]